MVRPQNLRPLVCLCLQETCVCARLINVIFYFLIRAQMVFIAGEGGGAGSRLTQDVGNILAQLPETVETLTGGEHVGVHQVL